MEIAEMVWLWGIGLALVVLVTGVAGLSVHGARKWKAFVEALTQRLESRLPGAAATVRPSHYDPHEISALPAPVQRYFRAVLRDGQPIISAVTVELTGTFNMSSTGQQWKPFASWQSVVTGRPGFVWNARIRMLPGIVVRVVDSYVSGVGLLRAAVLGLFTVAEVHGSGEIARGECMRYLAEAPWYPTALLPSQGVQWEAVDDTSANATLVDGPTTLTLLFRFNPDGWIDSVRAEARGAMVGKDMVMLPWEGRWSNYQACDGMTVPFTGEVAWIHPEGPKPYFIGRVTSLDFAFVP